MNHRDHDGAVRVGSTLVLVQPRRCFGSDAKDVQGATRLLFRDRIGQPARFSFVQHTHPGEVDQEPPSPSRAKREMQLTGRNEYDECTHFPDGSAGRHADVRIAPNDNLLALARSTLPLLGFIASGDDHLEP